MASTLTSYQRDQPLCLTGQPISIDDVISVAAGRPVLLDADCARRLEMAHYVMLRASEAGASVYGLTTGVGALKGVGVKRDEVHSFNRRLILSHRVASGDPIPSTVVRATICCRAQGLALGGSGVRPAVIEALLDILNENDIPVVHTYGSVGQADLAPLAEIAEVLIQRGLVLEEREALALIGANSLAIGWGALALDRTRYAIQALEMATALSMEASIFNPGSIDPAVFKAYPSPTLEQSILHLRSMLKGGDILEQRIAPRLLQDPLSIRVAPQTHATAREAYQQAVRIVEYELASASDNPLLTEDGRFLSVGNFDSSGLATAFDYARLGLAQALTLSCERVQKLLSAQHTGLPIGLRERGDLPEDGLAIVGHAAAALAAEARLLAAPVSLELPTSSIAESIEDRVIMAPLGARRLDLEAELSLRLAVIELVCATQAIDLRQRSSALGIGTRAIHAFVRKYISFLRSGETLNTDFSDLYSALEAQLRNPLFSWG
jgi:histidine ammonia-lyase